jgi:hypothetical protein
VTLIVDYTSLQAAVVEYLARDQDTFLIGRVPSFIQMSEAKFNRTVFVRQMEARSSTITDITAAEPEFLALPADFQSMRRMRLSAVSGSPSALIGKPNLEFMSGAQMEEFRQCTANAAAQPRYFSIFGSEIELAPTPDANYAIEMIYRANIPPLATNGTNWLLTMAPDLYLYGALMESAPYIKEDARLQTWGSGFKTALDDLNALGLTSTFNAGPMRVRASGVTP